MLINIDSFWKFMFESLFRDKTNAKRQTITKKVLAEDFPPA